jgi:ABC-2 type transport system ATP-binding protein
MNHSQLYAEDITVSLSGRRLLAPTSFALDEGCALRVVGPNGSGKSTLLRVLSGIIRPTSGIVTVAGLQPAERDSEFRSRLAALIGSPPFAANLTLREHMMLVSASWGLRLTASVEHTNGLLERFSLVHLSERFPHELSSGQLHLFAVALTFCRPFDILVLDEPERHLDADRIRLLTGVLRNLVEEGKTLVVASHHPSLLGELHHRILTLPLTHG